MEPATTTTEPRPRRTYFRPSAAWRADLARLYRQGLSQSQIARELSRLHHHPITRRMVRWYLSEDERMALDDDQAPPPPYDREQRRLVHMMQCGLGHLYPPLVLRQRESDILRMLRTRGPMTRQEVAGALGVRTLRTRTQYWLTRLQWLGLVKVQGWPPGSVLYHLDDLAKPPMIEPLDGILEEDYDG